MISDSEVLPWDVPEVAVRSDFDAMELRKLAGRSTDADQARRLLSLVAIYDGADPRRGGQGRRDGPPDASRLGAPLQQSRADGLINRTSTGRKRRLSTGQIYELEQIVEAGP